MIISKQTLSQQKARDFSYQEIQALYALAYTIPQYGKRINLPDFTYKALDKPLEEILLNNQVSIQELLQKWLKEEPPTFFCALLGDYGMGKTVSCMVLARWLLAQHSKNLLSPIYIDLRSIRGKKNIYHYSLNTILDLIIKGSISSGETKYGRLYAEEVIDLVENGKALIIFDGLDEVLIHLTRTQSKIFFQTLLNILPFKLRSNGQKKIGRVLFSCRTHFFKDLQDQKNFLLSEGSNHFLKNDDYTVLTILPLSKDQIKNYLKNVIPSFDTDSVFSLLFSVHNLIEISERPYTLSLIPHLIPYIDLWNKNNSNITTVTIYRHIILSCLERDTGKHLISSEHKMILLESFAADLWQSGIQYWNISHLEKWYFDWLNNNVGIWEHYSLNNIDIFFETLVEDLITGTLLVRLDDKNFCFAHTSIQEFFLACHLQRALVNEQAMALNFPLVSIETLNFLGQLLREEEDTSALTTLSAIQKTYCPQVSEQALAYLLLAHSKGYPSPGLAGFCLDGADLKGWQIWGETDNVLDFSGASFRAANLNEANLRYINLDNTDFSHAQLISAEILDGKAQKACFKDANLFGASFRDMSLEKANFYEVRCKPNEFIRCQLHDIAGLDSLLLDTLFVLCEPQNQCSKKLIKEKDHIAHLDAVCECAFSSDEKGTYLISSSWDKDLRIWNVSNGKCLKVFSGHQGRVRSCAFSPDNRHLATVSDDQTLRIWDRVTEQCLKVIHGHMDRGRSCIFSPDGKLIASTSVDQTLRLWDVVTGECVRVIWGHADALRGCVFSPDGQILASASDDRTVRLWEVDTGEALGILTGHTSWVQGCAFSPDGRNLVSASGDKTLRIWNVDTLKCQKTFLGHTNKVRSCSFSSDGKQLLSSSDDYTLRIWDVIGGECLKVLSGHQGRVFYSVFSPDKKHIASASEDQTLRLWDRATGGVIQSGAEIFHATNLSFASCRQ